MATNAVPPDQSEPHQVDAGQRLAWIRLWELLLRDPQRLEDAPRKEENQVAEGVPPPRGESRRGTPSPR